MTGYTFSQLFDFTRTTAGTFVGSNGLIQNTPASRNILTFTQEFDNVAWTKNATGTASLPAVTPNVAIAPDGTATADLIVFDRGAGNTLTDRSFMFQGPVTILNTTTYFGSCYIKAATPSDVGRQLAIRNVAASAYTVITLTNDWQRVGNAETSASTSGNFEIANRGTITADNSVSALVWGAQLEVGSSATTYTRNNGGLFPARFDYNPATLAPRGILIEEQRTNLATYSNDFADASWVVISAKNLVANTTVSPDGNVNASTLTDNSAVAYQGIGKSVTVANDNATYTASLYVRKTTGGTSATFGFNFQLSGGTIVTAQPRLNTDTGTLINGTGTVQDAGAYWRLTCTITNNTSGNTSLGLSLYPATSTYNVPADSAAATGSVIIYGAQIEAGSFATSYIPTVASQVTRSADLCAITAPMFAPWYNQSAGTFLVEYTQGSGTTARAATVASDGTNSNTVELYIDGSNDGSTLPFYGVYVAGVVQAALSFASAAQNATHKMGAAYQANDFAGSVDGATVVTDTSGSLPTVSRLSIGSSGTTASAFANGHIRSVRYYPFRASNNQLQQVTT